MYINNSFFISNNENEVYSLALDREIRSFFLSFFSFS
nr:MAG TPA: hypothetical protein [Caudoviricetes sp.]